MWKLIFALFSHCFHIVFTLFSHCFHIVFHVVFPAWFAPLTRAHHFHPAALATTHFPVRRVAQMGELPPLHRAALFGKVNDLKAELKKDPGKLNAPDAYGHTALYFCTQCEYKTGDKAGDSEECAEYLREQAKNSTPNQAADLWHQQSFFSDAKIQAHRRRHRAAAAQAARLQRQTTTTNPVQRDATVQQKDFYRVRNGTASISSDHDNGSKDSQNHAGDEDLENPKSEPNPLQLSKSTQRILQKQKQQLGVV